MKNIKVIAFIIEVFSKNCVLSLHNNRGLVWHSLGVILKTSQLKGSTLDLFKKWFYQEFEHIGSIEEINLPQPCKPSSPLAQKWEDIPVKYNVPRYIYFYVASILNYNCDLN